MYKRVHKDIEVDIIFPYYCKHNMIDPGDNGVSIYYYKFTEDGMRTVILENQEPYGCDSFEIERERCFLVDASMLESPYEEIKESEFLDAVDRMCKFTEGCKND